jgi:hypothetical protein
MKTNLLTGSLAALILAAGSATAATINVSGAYNLNAGNANAIGVGSAGQHSFSQGSGNDFVSGVVRFSNTSEGNGNQFFELTLTSFTFSSAAQGPVTLSIRIVQDFIIDGTVGSATGSHQVNGNANFSAAGQVVTASIISRHEETELPTLVVNPGAVGIGSGPVQTIINRGQGATTPVTVSGGIYTIDTTYTFTLNALGLGPVSIVLPDSGVDNATLLLVPLPPAAWAGLGGLAFVSGSAALRRRRLAKASA